MFFQNYENIQKEQTLWYHNSITLGMNIKEIIAKEEQRQNEGITLIASENHCPKEIAEVMGSCLTNKYSEGYPDARYYSGNAYIDEIEAEAISQAKKIFNMPHANVQPHSGSTANQAVYQACLQPGDTILSLSLDHGGHLTHGHKATSVGKIYDIVHYTVDPLSGRLNYENIEEVAMQIKPRLIIAGASNYPREIDFKKFKEIADKCGALLLTDIAHIAGLIVAGQHQSPAPFADFITTTTHKTLCGPRGGLILCQEKYAKKIDSAVFPGLQGGPLEHVIAAKALCFQRAQTQEFIEIQKQTIVLAQKMASIFQENGFEVISGGTDNHIITINCAKAGYNAADAVNKLEAQGVYTNFNALPGDTSVKNPSGIRMGTAAMATRGFTEQEVDSLTMWIIDCIKNDADHSQEIKEIALKHKPE